MTPPVGYYAALDFNCPLGEATADQIIADLSTLAPQQVLDVGCGWAELLLRLLEVCPEARGHGVDHDEGFIERASHNAADRGLQDRVAFSAGVDAVATMAPDLVLCVGSEHVFGTRREALDVCWGLVRPGGRLLLGTLFWERSPTPELVEQFGELPSIDVLIDVTVEAGWRPLGLTVATLLDWDHFEFGYLADWEQQVMSPSDRQETDVAAAQDAADGYRRAYLQRRGILGFAFVTLGRPEQPA